MLVDLVDVIIEKIERGNVADALDDLRRFRWTVRQVSDFLVRYLEKDLQKSVT